MLYRKIMTALQEWKEKESTALLLDGARQVGKTYIIKEFIKTFHNSIEIDFTKNSTALDYLLEIKNYEDFVNRLGLISPTKLNDGNDALFLDEIQYYYEMRERRIQADPLYASHNIDILTLTKEIAQRGGFRIIMSGSLLGVAVMNINLNPVGYCRKITMYPLDFEEFLLANGIGGYFIGQAKQAFIDRKPLSESIHRLFLDKFREYVLIGGFPASVQGYIDDKTLSESNKALSSIDAWYRADISKYADVRDRLIIQEMYSRLPSEINGKNRKFVKSHLDSLPNFKNLDLMDRFLWLKSAGIAIPTYNVSNPKYPLSVSLDHKIVKVFMGDVGLLTYHLFGEEDKRSLLVSSKGYDLGAVYENAVAELLTAHGYEPRFHSRVKRGEIDFIIEKNMGVCPLEIKSSEPDKTSGFYSHPALNNLLDDHREIKDAWVFGINNVKRENDRIQMFPIYMIDFVRR